MAFNDLSNYLPSNWLTAPTSPGFDFEGGGTAATGMPTGTSTSLTGTYGSGTGTYDPYMGFFSGPGYMGDTTGSPYSNVNGVIVGPGSGPNSHTLYGATQEQLNTPWYNPVTGKFAPHGEGVGSSGGGMSSMGGSLPPLPTWNQPGWNDQYQASPYLNGMADNIKSQATNWLGDQMNGIRSNAIGVGGLGGSRQGVAQGVAAAQGQNMLAGQLANLYNSDYQNWQNRNLQKYQTDLGAASSRYGTDAGLYGAGLNYNLGMTNAQNNLQLGMMGAQNQADANRNSFYLGNRSLDLTSQMNGAQLQNMAITNEWLPVLYGNQVFGNYANNGTTSTQVSGGGGWPGALGGAAGTYAYGHKMEWW